LEDSRLTTFLRVSTNKIPKVLHILVPPIRLKIQIDSQGIPNLEIDNFDQVGFSKSSFL